MININLYIFTALCSKKDDLFSTVTLNEYLQISKQDFNDLWCSIDQPNSEKPINFTDNTFDNVSLNELLQDTNDDFKVSHTSSDPENTYSTLFTPDAQSSRSLAKSFFSTAEQDKGFCVKKQKTSRYREFGVDGTETHFKIKFKTLQENDTNALLWVQNALQNIFFEIQSLLFSHCAIYVTDRYCKNTKKNIIFIRKEKLDLAEFIAAFMQKLNESLKGYSVLTVICHTVNIL